MASYRLKRYPRGFLGAVLGMRGEHLAANSRPSLNYGTGGLTVAPQTQPDTSNADVEALYNQYIHQHENTRNFEFCERVLRTALSAFGTVTFEAWFEAQYKNPSAGDLHGRFLLDTLKFLREGRRNVSLETWGSLIGIASAGSDIGEMPQEAKEFFGIGQSYRESYSMTELLQRWMSQPSGFEDLLGTLHILFGNPAV